MNINYKQQRLERAENYINSYLSTMMTVLAVLITVCVGILSVITKNDSPNYFDLIIILLILISVGFFTHALWMPMSSHGTLILAVKAGKSGYDKASQSANKFDKSFFTGLCLLAVTCLIYFIASLRSHLQFLGFPNLTALTPYYPRIIGIVSYSVLSIGSFGMICFVNKFHFSTLSKDYKLVSEKIFWLKGSTVLILSWILIHDFRPLKIIVDFS